LVVQALGLASGILLVRTLDQQQYAYFTIANTMQGTMNVLADSGISSGLTAIGGKIWQDRYRFSQLINTAMQLRRYLAAIAIVAITPILLWMLISNGASIVYAVLITIVVLVGINFQLTIGVLSVVPRLHSQINRVQNLDLISAISRLIFLCFAYFTYLNAAVAILIASITFGLQYFFLNSWVIDSFEKKVPVHHEYQLSLLKIVKHQAPNAIFYCVQGQLTIWLMNIFGNTKNIAEFGALGRLAVIFSVIGAVMTSIVLPSFARCQSVSQLRHRYFQALGSCCLFGACLVTIAAFFPRELLWILGNKYAHLKNEVLLMVISAVLNLVSGIMLSLNSSKGWVQYYWLNIPFILLIEACLTYFLDLTSTYGVLLFGTLSIIPGIIFSSAISYIKLFRTSTIDME
jgi:O-antigen/teichoic acid export membrane protein